ncbi:BPM1 [Symbiodinium natans]|uniref:BPM1 protein n=1 Tax=Symbiodinium natans TaxID=878477 RepID=A0A812PK58_9DINO|nr:BPM1 [Symbiodinium natans]
MRIWGHCIEDVEAPRSAAMSATMTAEELQAQIEATRRDADAEEARFVQLEAESAQAQARQRLRRELEQQAERLDAAREINDDERSYRLQVDEDMAGDYCPGGPSPAIVQTRAKRSYLSQARGEESMSFGSEVARGEYVWKLRQFSWMRSALRQDCEAYAESDDFQVGSCRFTFRYNPTGGLVFSKDGRRYDGSLVIKMCGEIGDLIRYRIYVRKPSCGDFVQWSAMAEVIHSPYLIPPIYGPDVHLHGSPHSGVGIFGLTFEELLQSEWVEDDTLTLKFVLEVRPYDSCTKHTDAVKVPEPTMTLDNRALLEEAVGSDVQFTVQGEVIQAHSQVLCARSEVFRKQLTGGMQESVSKNITIEDSDVATFKAFLQFLYTDNLPDVQELIPAGTSSQSDDGSSSRQLSQLQALLAVSNKYQATRLQLWCEAKLCEELNTSQVCSILCQAHLFQAKQLERACLSHIKGHMAEVLKLPAYTELVAKWPEIGVEVSLFLAGMPQAEASEVAQASKVRRLEAGKERTFGP